MSALNAGNSNDEGDEFFLEVLSISPFIFQIFFSFEKISIFQNSSGGSPVC
jgi:hypothetical protein